MAKEEGMQSSTTELARKLVQLPSLNPPGQERDCIAFLGDMLTEAGLEVRSYEFAPGRPSIVARAEGSGSAKPLAFTGHVDVVPLGEKPWTVDPFAGEIRGGKLFGRGASDMKAGVPAFVTATLAHVRSNAQLKRGITLVITAGEETGCEGAFHLARQGKLGSADLLIVAEPSSNLPIIAHKGSVRLRISAKGKTAHSSMPELGDNAIYKITTWIGSSKPSNSRLKATLCSAAQHPR
jgi:succinyl-diaminopimelate desuccinylase